VGLFQRSTQPGPAAADAAAPPEDGQPAAEGEASPGLRGRLGAWWEAKADTRARLHAWWEGYDAPAPKAEPEPAPAPKPVEKKDEAPGINKNSSMPERWSAARVKIAELIWGDGFSFPGSIDHTMEMVKPFGLTKEKSMLDMGCGLGGATRAITKAFGTYMQGMDVSPALAKAGMGQSEKAGLTKKAPIEWFDPATVELPPKKFEAILVRQILCPTDDKKRLLKEITKALKPGGMLMVTDFVLPEKGAKGPAFEAWAKGEDHPPKPITLAELTKAFADNKVEVRVAEDMSASFRALVTAGWAKLADLLKPGALGPVEAKTLVTEIELWQRRLSALAANELQIVRVFGIKRV
jgi:ubiquinone/menaquinone biosynthesis C-methylase UbiE